MKWVLFFLFVSHLFSPSISLSSILRPASCLCLCAAAEWVSVGTQSAPSFYSSLARSPSPPSLVQTGGLCQHHDLRTSLTHPSNYPPIQPSTRWISESVDVRDLFLLAPSSSSANLNRFIYLFFIIGTVWGAGRWRLGGTTAVTWAASVSQ